MCLTKVQRDRVTGTRTHNQQAEVSNSNSSPPAVPRPEAPGRAWLRATRARGGGNPERSWKPGLFNIVPEVSEIVLISFHSFFFFPL